MEAAYAGLPASVNEGRRFVMLKELREQARLTVLRVRVARPDEPDDTVMLEFEQSGTLAARWRVAAAEMRVPYTARDFDQLSEPGEPQAGPLGGSAKLGEWLVRAIRERLSPVRLPERVLNPLRILLASGASEQPQRILWLEIGEPHGYLPLLAWEKVLQRPLRVRIIRLPYETLKPISAPSDPLEVVLCASAPGTAPRPEQLTALVRDVLDSVPRRCRMHVFGDEDQRPRLAELLRTVPAQAEKLVVVCDPAEAFAEASKPAQAEPTGERPPDPAVEHPWTHWMRRALGGTAAEVVHFICGAVWAGERSYLTVAKAPTAVAGVPSGKTAVRFVTAREIHSLLTALGASTSIFTVAGGFFPRRALRQIIDQVARLRPGAIVLHDPRLDQGNEALRGTYRFLFGGPDEALPGSDAVTIFCHPWRLVSEQLPIMDPESSLAQSFLTARQAIRRAAEAPGPTQTWVATTQRYLEREFSRSLEAQPQSAAEAASQAGVEEELKFLSDALARHVPASKPPETEG